MAKITWNRNLEHEGLQLQSSEKPSQDIINQLKANGFRWSPRQKLWYAKETSYRVEFLSSIAAYEGEVGERLTFAEKMDAKVKHAADRAERFEALAEKTHDKANQLHSDAERMASVIPFGQPILIGHHSERSDRNYRDRIHNKYGKAFETFDKAKEYEEKASTASEYESRIFNVGTTESISIEDLAKKVKEMCDSKSRIEYMSYEEAFEEGFEDMMNRMPCLDKVKEYIGYEPKYSLDDIIRRMIEYYEK